MKQTNFWQKQWRQITMLSAVLLLGVVIFIPGRRTFLKPLSAESPANNYIKEFRSYKFPQNATEWAPDRSAKIERANVGWGPKAFAACHTLRLIDGDGKSRNIITAREADPGSGLSFSWGWSQDSRAVFIRGQTSGLDCRSDIQGDLSVIYTTADNSAWSIPGQP